MGDKQEKWNCPANMPAQVDEAHFSGRRKYRNESLPNGGRRPNNETAARQNVKLMRIRRASLSLICGLKGEMFTP